MGDDLQARLRDHAKAFDGLLSLIPAKMYYSGDTDDQWQRKKQTKEEARAAKRAKLDPKNAKSAKDIMEENARKRKREEDGEISEVEGISTEAPKEGLKVALKKTKKQKNQEHTGLQQPKSEAAPMLEDSASRTAIVEKKRAKRERKKAKVAVIAEKKRLKKARKQQLEDPLGEPTNNGDDLEDDDSSDGGDHVQIDPIEVDGLVEESETGQSTATPSPDQSPAFENSNPLSGTSSISSILDQSGTKAESTKKAGQFPTPKVDSEELKVRLQKRIEALRAARKADNDGNPARSRQELIESRRQKEEQRKAHKKELRQQSKEEERKRREEELSQGSPLLSPSIMSPRASHGQSPLSEPSNSFAFGRIAFGNGQSMTADLDGLLQPHKQKGPQDAHTALEALKNREARIAGLDPAKRADIEEKNTWLNARKRAHGERIRDDSSLLKKTLKRKDKEKKKSEKEWGERLAGVAKGQAMRQKKRTENLQKRKDEKGSKGKKGSKSTKPKSKARPGFEGSFRAGGKRK